jgi:lipopolysaccharide transport system ATP-binding protein
MSDTVIQVDHLSKQYRLGAIGGKRLVDDVNRWWARLRGKDDPLSKIGRATPRQNKCDGSPTGKTFWALKDVSFEVKQGEVLGIIGRNGAGKSTLLKILSRVTAPASGEVRIKGRIASLLEVGTGFHPELTGRENIYLNGAILGMTKAEVRQKFDEIVAFSNVENFIDTPVKRYSSGMTVRLAFAVAAHLEPEILIVDEVLAVGDAEFQRKCLGKMAEVARGGRTVLFVSHNLQAISNLTTQCLLLRSGKVAQINKPEKVIAAYLDDGEVKDQVFSAPPSPDTPSVSRVEVVTSEPNNIQTNGKAMRLIFDVTVPGLIRSAAFSFQIVDSMMQPVVHLGLFDSELQLSRGAGTYRLICELPNLRLYLGRYSITAHLAEAKGGAHFQTIEGICPFEVVMFGSNRSWQGGTCRYLEEGNWTVTHH